MKMLTSISIILMFPTLIASLLGMNLVNGMENWAWALPWHSYGILSEKHGFKAGQSKKTGDFLGFHRFLYLICAGLNE